MPAVSPATERLGFAQISTANALALAAQIGGYAWWYVEVHDAAQRFGLTLILFAGSVFSAEYAARLRRGEPVTGLQVPACNLAVYERARQTSQPTDQLTSRPTQKLWVMNEYPEAALRTTDQSITVASSQLSIEPDGSLRIDLHERATLFFGKPGPLVRGQLRLSPPQFVGPPLLLGQSARHEAHFWQPLSLCSQAVVDLQVDDEPIQFRGAAYCDHNYGSGRLEDCFARWSWAHGFSEDKRVGAVVYDTTALDGTRHRIGLLLSSESSQPAVEESFEPPPPDEPGPDGRDFLWLKVPRALSAGTLHCRRQPGERLLDAPFYARFGVELSDEERLPGCRLRGVGEYLDLHRFRRPALQFLLRYKTHLAGRSDDGERFQKATAKR
ncbi:MAG: hypothetical protein KAY55_00710 [Deltaproteobacteria bacterium]|nr:hypothetical protein [Deltaproteobacteria bacterium]